MIIRDLMLFIRYGLTELYFCECHKIPNYETALTSTYFAQDAAKCILTEITNIVFLCEENSAEWS